MTMASSINTRLYNTTNYRHYVGHCAIDTFIGLVSP